MKRSLGSHLALLATLGITSVLHPTVAQAAQFSNTEIADQQSRFVVMASPIGTTGSYKLLIFEQLNNRRQCWGEVGNNPTVIDPLFMQFDFTGICGRSTDSNAYSVRVAGEDLVGRYHLRLVRKANELVLIGFSLVDKDVEFFEIGRTRGLAEGYLKIELDPGWRLTRRTFKDKPVGHIYLTNDRTLQEIANTAAPIVPEAPTQTPIPQPTPLPTDPLIPPQSPSTTTDPVLLTPPPPPPPQPNDAPAPIVPTVPQSPPNTTDPSLSTPSSQPNAPQAPGTPASGGYVVPTLPGTATPDTPAAAPKSLPTSWNSRPSGSIVVPTGGGRESSTAAPMGIDADPSLSSTGYRVVVEQPSLAQQNQVRQIVPSAFRTTINGQSVMQVGVFRDRTIANSLQQQLVAQNIAARILPTTIAAAPRPTLPTSTTPSLPLPTNPLGAGTFNLPQPTATAQLAPTLLWSTYYYTHRAEAMANTSSTAYPLLDPSGNNLGVHLSQRDWCAAALQGSVQVVSSQQIWGTYNFAGRGDSTQVDCSAFYPKLSTVEATNRVRFKRSNSVFGEGVGGHSLVPYRTIAVDKTQIPIGSVVYIPDARGTVVTLPSGQQAIHDGYFYAADVGAAIKGNHIDVFIGVAKQNPFRFVKSTPSGTFTAYIINNPQIQAFLSSAHRSSDLASR